MRDDRLLFVLLALYLMIIAALLIKDAPIAKAPTTKQDTTPEAEDISPVAKQDDAEHGASPVDTSGKRGLTPNCEKELRHTTDLLRFFANRRQMGEDTQSILADMMQQEKKLSAVCYEP